jgi:uncharacterized protein (DUF2252 family)
MNTAIQSPDPNDRLRSLTATRRLKMARSAHAYVRGSTEKFYEWLEASDAKLPNGPAVWICGDCHVGNLGPIADAKGRIAVQIRDLDQTVIGNPAHDLIRMGLSLASSARGSNLSGVTTARVIEELMAGYQTAMSGNFDESQKDRSYRPASIQRLLSQSARRRWRHLADERLSEVEPSLLNGKRFWPLTEKERGALDDMLSSAEAHKLVVSLQDREDDAPVKLVDAAYWVKGCSSLGRVRYAALLRVGRGRNSGLCLVDIKEATQAAAPRIRGAAMPADDAVRVVTGARALSPNLGNRMIASQLVQRPVVLRELLPQDIKLDVDRLSTKEAVRIARYLANVVGRAHGRQMDAAARGRWFDQLERDRVGRLEAPSWLWTSIVELLSLHEPAYLEHCRRYALGQAEA